MYCSRPFINLHKNLRRIIRADIHQESSRANKGLKSYPIVVFNWYNIGNHEFWCLSGSCFGIQKERWSRDVRAVNALAGDNACRTRFEYEENINEKLAFIPRHVRFVSLRSCCYLGKLKEIAILIGLIGILLCGGTGVWDKIIIKLRHSQISQGSF